MSIRELEYCINHSMENIKKYNEKIKEFEKTNNIEELKYYKQLLLKECNYFQTQIMYFQNDLVRELLK